MKRLGAMYRKFMPILFGLFTFLYFFYAVLFLIDGRWWYALAYAGFGMFFGLMTRSTWLRYYGEQRSKS